MAKKKKIREDFDVIFASGNEKSIKKILDKYPWLLDEVSSEMKGNIGEQQQMIAALGVMEDALDEIIFSLRIDFNIRKTEEEVHEILSSTEDLSLVKREVDGWSLTPEGGKVCDDFLNRTLGKIEF